MHAVENMKLFLTKHFCPRLLAASGKCWRCGAGWELSGCWRPHHMRSDSYLHGTERLLPATLEQSHKNCTNTHGGDLCDPTTACNKTQRSTERAWHLTEDLVVCQTALIKQLLWRDCVRQFVNRLPTTTHLSIRLHVRSASIIIFHRLKQNKRQQNKDAVRDSTHFKHKPQTLDICDTFRRQEASCFLLSLWCQQLE